MENSTFMGIPYPYSMNVKIGLIVLVIIGIGLVILAIKRAIDQANARRKREEIAARQSEAVANLTAARAERELFIANMSPQEAAAYENEIASSDAATYATYANAKQGKRDCRAYAKTMAAGVSRMRFTERARVKRQAYNKCAAGLA